MEFDVVFIFGLLLAIFILFILYTLVVEFWERYIFQLARSMNEEKLLKRRANIHNKSLEKKLK